MTTATKRPTPKHTYSECDALLSEAHQAGMAATEGMQDTACFGGCGFAWVTLRPANCRLAKRIVAAGMGRKNDYDGSMQVWVSMFGQDCNRKTTYAYAFAAVLWEAGYRAYGGSRLD